MFEAFRSRWESEALVQGSDQEGQRRGQPVDLRTASIRRKTREDLPDIAPQGDSVDFLHGDQVRLAREEPEERVTLEGGPARQEGQVLWGRRSRGW